MSLLWVVATEVHTGMMPLSEMDHLHSGDFCVPMQDVYHEMHNAWNEHQEWGDGEPHSKWVEHGGPDAYIQHLTGQIEREGMLDPIKVLHAPEGHGHDGGEEDGSDRTWIDDGHHRYLAACNAGLSHVPVEHHYGHYEPDRKRLMFPEIGVEH